MSSPARLTPSLTPTPGCHHRCRRARRHVLMHLARNRKGRHPAATLGRTGRPSHEYKSVATRAAPIEETRASPRRSARPGDRKHSSIRATSKALSLLPGWTQWCASKTALDAEAAGRALAAARAEAAILASEMHTITEDEAPFRRPE
jgi:hypothetical protein